MQNKLILCYGCVQSVKIVGCEKHKFIFLLEIVPSSHVGAALGMTVWLCLHQDVKPKAFGIHETHLALTLCNSHEMLNVTCYWWTTEFVVHFHIYSLLWAFLKGGLHHRLDTYSKTLWYWIVNLKKCWTQIFLLLFIIRAPQKWSVSSWRGISSQWFYCFPMFTKDELEM